MITTITKEFKPPLAGPEFGKIHKRFGIDYGSKKLTHVIFDDPDEVMDLVEKSKKNTLFDKYGYNIENFLFDESLTEGGAGGGYDDCVELYRGGWKEGLEKASGMIESIESKIIHGMKVKQEPEYQVSGGMPDIGIFMSGDPECFISKKSVQVSGMGRIARIRVCLGASSDVPAKAILARGVCIIALIDTLEKCGISTQIDAIRPMYSDEMDQYFMIEIPMKRPNMICDDDRLAFCLGHPSYIRRILARTLTLIGDYDSALGKSVLDFFPDEGDIMIPPCSSLSEEDEVDLFISIVEKSFSF